MIVAVIARVAQTWRDGGWLLLPIALTAFGIWAYGLRLLYTLRQALENAAALEKRLEAAPPATVATAFAAANCAPREFIEQAAPAALGRVQQDFRILKALTAAAPLLGLLGTVTGMVATFAAVSRYGDGGAAPVADGIRAALLTTQFGLVAALPGVFGLSHLDNLLQRLRSSLNAIGSLLQRPADGRLPKHA